MALTATAIPFCLKPLAITAGCIGMIGSVAAWAADDPKLKAYGEHLARECTACHRLDGVDNGIPSIVGWPADTFISTMKFYADGARTNPVMVSVAGSLTEKQLEALALFFASVPKPQPRPAPPGPGNRKP
jgi:cytochrome c553